MVNEYYQKHKERLPKETRGIKIFLKKKEIKKASVVLGM